MFDPLWEFFAYDQFFESADQRLFGDDGDAKENVEPDDTNTEGVV